MEKALAKMQGSYEEVRRMTGKETFVALTGAPTDEYRTAEWSKDEITALVKEALKAKRPVTAGS